MAIPLTMSACWPRGGRQDVSEIARVLRNAFSRTAICPNEEYRGNPLDAQRCLAENPGNNPEQGRSGKRAYRRRVQRQCAGESLTLSLPASMSMNVLGGEQVKMILLTPRRRLLQEAEFDDKRLCRHGPMRL